MTGSERRRGDDGRFSTSDRRRGLPRPPVAVSLVLVAGVLLTVAGYLFAPWRLVVDDEVNEPLPGPAAGAEPAAQEPARGTKVVARGRFVSHEHQTSGLVRVLELAGGRRVLRFEGFETSNGPDLRVWLTDADVVEGRAGWFAFDDGRHVDLGRLHGNVGSQNYTLPENVDLGELHSVSIWCRRFHVSFGAAELSLGP